MAEKLDAAPAADIEVAPAVTDKSAFKAEDVGKAFTSGAKAEVQPEKPLTVAEGADDTEVKVPQNYPDNWRELMAGSDKASLKELARYQSPEGVWKKVKALQTTVHDKTIPKKPADDAEPEVIAEYRKTVGLAESPEKLLENIKLSDGRTIGENDKPLVEDFVKTVWQDMPPSQTNKVLDWYYAKQEQIAAQQFEADENYMVESRRSLKEEWGPEFQRNTKQIGTLFKDAPEGVQEMMLAARDPQGRVLGNNPDVVKFLSALAFELNPHPTMMHGEGGGGSASNRLAEIQAMMSKDPDQYWTPKIQAEELSLISAQRKQESRRAA